MFTRGYFWWVSRNTSIHLHPHLVQSCLDFGHTEGPEAQTAAPVHQQIASAVLFSAVRLGCLGVALG